MTASGDHVRLLQHRPDEVAMRPFALNAEGSTGFADCARRPMVAEHRAALTFVNLFIGDRVAPCARGKEKVEAGAGPTSVATMLC
jgi:hypothetical protein